MSMCIGQIEELQAKSVIYIVHDVYVYWLNWGIASKICDIVHDVYVYWPNWGIASKICDIVHDVYVYWPNWGIASKICYIHSSWCLCVLTKLRNCKQNLWYSSWCLCVVSQQRFKSVCPNNLVTHVPLFYCRFATKQQSSVFHFHYSDFVEYRW